ncbi:MAG: preprotein translocase subunit SecD [Actinomycetota bacterium]|jgi:preprotein translocase subunit SecD|nr:preprotein translocase subunit SecD [Actinomycetota bacterium]
MTTTGPAPARRASGGRTPLIVVTVLVLLAGVAAVLLADHHTGRPDDSPPAAACPRSSVTAQVSLVAGAAATPDQLDDAAGILTHRLAVYGCGDVRVAGDRLAVSTSAAGERHIDDLITPGVLQLREVLEAQPGTRCPTATRAAPVGELASACSTDHSELYRLGPAQVGGEDVKGATAERDQQLGEWQVIMHFTDAGQRRFTDLTSQLVGKQMAIVLDGEVIAAPRIMEQIDGDAQITGSFTEESAKALASTLEYGALPILLQRG